jgi:hypothetical protein
MTDCAPFRASCVGNHVQQALARPAPESGGDRRPSCAWRGSPRPRSPRRRALSTPRVSPCLPLVFTSKQASRHGQAPARAPGPTDLEGEERARYRRALTPAVPNQGTRGEATAVYSLPLRAEAFSSSGGEATKLSLSPFVSLELPDLELGHRNGPVAHRACRVDAGRGSRPGSFPCRIRSVTRSRRMVSSPIWLVSAGRNRAMMLASARERKQRQMPTSRGARCAPIRDQC